MNKVISVRKTASWSVAVGCLLLVAISVNAGEIQAKFESPVDSTVYQGIANVRGWAISSVGIDRVELYIDGVYATDIPAGGLRQDVGSAFPGFPGSDQSGFSMAYNYSRLSVGPHTFRIKVIDKDAAVAEKIANVNVLSFDTVFIANPNALNLSGATVNAAGTKLSIKNMTLDGKLYDADLTWRPETQRYQFTSIVLQ